MHLITTIEIIIKMSKLKPMHIIVIGAGITIIGTIIVAVGTFLQNKASSVKSDSIKFTVDESYTEIKHLKSQNNNLKNTISEQNKDLVEAYKQLNLANATLNDKSDRIEDAQSKLIISQDQYSRLQTEMNNQSVAKDSKPIIELSTESFTLRKGIININIYNDGNYPITGIKIYFKDPYTPEEDIFPDKILNHAEFRALAYQQDQKTRKVVDVGSLSKGNKRKNIYTFIITNQTSPAVHLDFEVVWKDGSYTCSGWFKNPQKYLDYEPPQGIAESMLQYLNKLTFKDNSGKEFIPQPYNH
jgi:hypothetical protein